MRKYRVGGSQEAREYMSTNFILVGIVIKIIITISII